MKKHTNKKQAKAKLKPRNLVVTRLENVSKLLFSKHFELVTKLVGKSPGVYALYDGNELYYVGKSTDLRKRVKHHLRDRHYASWTHFSLYLVRKSEHVGEIESLLVRIANPKGNRSVPKGKSSGAMMKELKAMVRRKQKKEFDEMFGGKEYAARAEKKVVTEHPRTLRRLVTKQTPLYRTYKGKDYKAILTRGGTIKLGVKKFSTPTAAAKAVVERRSVNGWKFWYIEDSRGEWVRLSDYRG